VPIKNPQHILMAAGGFAALVVVLLAVATFWVISGNQQQVKQLNNEIASLQAAASNSMIADEAALVEDAVSTYRMRVPMEQRVNQMISQIIQDSDALGSRDRKLTTNPSVVKGSLVYMPIDLKFVGGFKATTELLQRIENYTNLVRVDALMLERDPMERNADLDVSLELTALARVNPEDVK